MPTRLLLIDDNMDQVVITKKTLAKIGPDYELDSAPNGKEGIEKLKKNAYDIVLCDYRLPDLSGIEVLKQMKECGNTTPFIIVTSMGNERLAAEAMKGGAYDYVVKDASYEEILPEILRQSLERYSERKALKQERDQLESMNKIMMNREERILELKRQVDALLKELGRPPQYGG